MNGRFQPGDTVRLVNKLAAFESITGTPSNSNAGSLAYGRRTGIIVSTSPNGYNVDFGGRFESCIFISEQYLARA